MGGSIKRFLYKRLSIENYLRVLQQGYFFAYFTGLLKLSSKYDTHYYARHLVGRGDVVIDIGANLGYYSLLFSRWCGKRGHVFSVEPVELFNRVFKKKARRRRNITLLPYALGAEEGSVELIAPFDKEVGYMQTGRPHIVRDGGESAVAAAELLFQAEMRRPSELFAELDRIDYVKCDVEGFEMEVLSDMLPLLVAHRPIVQVEVWDDNLSPILAMFESLNYIPTKVRRNELLCDQVAMEIDGDFIFLPSELSFHCM